LSLSSFGSSLVSSSFFVCSLERLCACSWIARKRAPTPNRMSREYHASFHFNTHHPQCSQQPKANPAGAWADSTGHSAKHWKTNKSTKLSKREGGGYNYLLNWDTACWNWGLRSNSCNSSRVRFPSGKRGKSCSCTCGSFNSGRIASVFSTAGKLASEEGLSECTHTKTHKPSNVSAHLVVPESQRQRLSLPNRSRCFGAVH